MMPDRGRTVFTISDKAANMGAVTSVKVTVDEIRAHSTTEDWITVSSQSKTYDLLQLEAENKNALLADVQLKEGTYDQLRLEISKVVVTDASGDHEAKLPSNELRVQGRLEVRANETATADFDFQTDQSLHVTGNGKYIMAPVVKVQTRSDAEVTVKSQTDVVITDGDILTDITIGTDLDGNVGVNIRVPANANISIVGNVITISGSSEANATANQTTRIRVGSRGGTNVSVRTGVGVY